MQTAVEQMRAWESFLRAHAAVVPILARELEQARRIPLNYYDVLVQLANAKRRKLRLNELNQRLVLSQSALSRLVDRMEADGLVAREPDPTDRRGTVVSMTHPGLTALRQAAPVHRSGIEHHFSCHMSEAEARTLAAIMDRVRAAARAESNPPTEP